MTDLLERAISRIRQFPPEMQDAAARVLLDFAGERDDDDAYQLTPEEEIDLAAAEDEAARGLFATDEEVEAVFAKYAR